MYNFKHPLKFYLKVEDLSTCFLSVTLNNICTEHVGHHITVIVPILYYSIIPILFLYLAIGTIGVFICFLNLKFKLGFPKRVCNLNYIGLECRKETLICQKCFINLSHTNATLLQLLNKMLGNSVMNLHITSGGCRYLEICFYS